MSSNLTALSRIALVACAGLAMAACSKVTAEKLREDQGGHGLQGRRRRHRQPRELQRDRRLQGLHVGDEKSGVTVHFAADKVMIHSADNIK